MDDDTEDNDAYTFELMRNIENEIKNEVRDLTDHNSDEDEIFDETEENTDDEAEEETLPSREDYWKMDWKYLQHRITKYITLVRFEQPLSTHILKVSKSIYLPKSQVSIDEMVARFRERSSHIVQIKNKPIPEGYKIPLLCDSEYMYCFVFTSRIESVESNSEINLILNVNKISHMRKNRYGGCRTVRTNTSKFPTCLKIKKLQKLEWDTLSGAVVNDVLVVFWMDNRPVTMLTTIHEILDDENRKVLPIPAVIDDYNYHMGGVDIADQLRGYYGVQVPNLVEESLEMGQNLHTQKKIAMIQLGLQKDQDLQRSFYVTKKFDLPIE
ncbi:4958_t:CDS:2 [Cetraspora pellucida]|uniref:4958_t:CDS:1 n=1 Tax=Cetraspora pellucida TaxID=1433469 RepID=A0A9N9NK41_9GLOM|nr:4958_t:CDS:2 [Cetraspora pellucida]